MKIFTVIFSLYILCLSLMPCSDSFNDCVSNVDLTETTQPHQHKSDHNDLCSPFCTCACCSISASVKFIPFTIKLAKVVTNSKINFPNQEFTFISNFYSNIWQPPKIS